MNHGTQRLGVFHWVLVLTLCRLFRGGNTSTLSNLNPENKRRKLALLSALIEYPGIGLILFETGCAEDINVVCHIHIRPLPKLWLILG